MILVLALLAVALVVWWLLWMYRPSKARERAAVDLSQDVQGARDKTRNWIGRLRLPFRKDKDLAIWFSRWVVDANLTKRIAVYKRLPEDAAEFTAWVGSLSNKELARFVNDLSGLCRSLGFDLAWLLDSKVPGDMKRGMEEAVILCSLTAWKARDVEPLAAFVAWQKAPHKPENRAFANALYAKLVEAGLTTTSAHMILAPEKERQKAVAQAIETAAAEHRTAFPTLIKEVMADLESADGTARTGSGTIPPAEAAASQAPEASA